MNIIERWLMLCSRFDALAVRERVLLFGSSLAGVYLIFETLLIMPVSDNHEKLMQDITAIQKKIDQIATEKQVFDRVAQRDPDANLKRERLKLQGRLLQLDNGLDELSLRLVPSDQLPEMLRAISLSAETVSLKSLRTLPPEMIDIGKERPQMQQLTLTGVPIEPAEKIYRHAIRLTLEGEYFNIAHFLKSIENLSWRFYWEGIDYRVTRFPRAIVDVELYTMATDEGMLSGR